MKIIGYLLLGGLLFCWPKFSNAEIPAPIDLKVQLLSEGPQLTWSPSALSNIKGYNIYVKRPGSDHFVRITPQPITESTATFKRMKVEQEYEIGVSAVDETGQESSLSKIKVIQKNPALLPPSGFKAENFETGIQLIWDKADPVWVSGFNLYLADESGQPVRKLTRKPMTDNQAILTKVKPDKIYRFLLKAVAVDGQEGPPTQVLEVTHTNDQVKALTTPATTPVVNPAESKQSPKPSSGSWFLELAGGEDFSGKNWQPAYQRGPGGKISLGYEWDKSLSVQLDVEGFYFSGTNYTGSISDAELLVLPTLRYAFVKEGFRPYLLGGAGGNFEFLSASPGLVTLENFDIAVGAGLEIQLGPQAYIFAEWKYNFIFFSEINGQDIPVLAGLRFGL